MWPSITPTQHPCRLTGRTCARFQRNRITWRSGNWGHACSPTEAIHECQTTHTRTHCQTIFTSDVLIPFTGTHQRWIVTSVPSRHQLILFKTRPVCECVTTGILNVSKNVSQKEGWVEQKLQKRMGKDSRRKGWRGRKGKYCSSIACRTFLYTNRLNQLQKDSAVTEINISLKTWKQLAYYAHATCGNWLSRPMSPPIITESATLWCGTSDTIMYWRRCRRSDVMWIILLPKCFSPRERHIIKPYCK